VAPGLWIWRLPYPDWRPDVGWEERVGSTCVESGGEVALLDPLAPPEDDEEVWARLDARPPTLIVILKPDHRNETPLWLPEQRTLVFADALTAPAGELRVWATPALEARALPVLRAMLELPFERVIVSHGAPVHDRAEFRAGARTAALDRRALAGEPRPSDHDQDETSICACSRGGSIRHDSPSPARSDRHRPES
jgi:hypothetical protein